jgi:hypothetical protein
MRIYQATRPVIATLALLHLFIQHGASQTAPKRPVVNGDFEDSPVGQPPAGWKAAYATGTAAVATDGKDTFLRLTNAQPANAGMAQVLDVPLKVTSVTVLGRMRGKPQNEKVDKQAAVQVALRYLDAAGASINAAIVASENSPNWHTFKREFKLPPGCAKVEVVARSIFAVGTFDFDEVRVEFK